MNNRVLRGRLSEKGSLPFLLCREECQFSKEFANALQPKFPSIRECQLMPTCAKRVGECQIGEEFAN